MSNILAKGSFMSISFILVLLLLCSHEKLDTLRQHSLYGMRLIVLIGVCVREEHLKSIIVSLFILLVRIRWWRKVCFQKLSYILFLGFLYVFVGWIGCEWHSFELLKH